MKIFMLPRKDDSPKVRLGAKLKIFGAIQIIIGLACAAVGLTSIGIDRNRIELFEEANKTSEAYIILGLDSAPIISSIWIIIAGLLPSCLICGSDFNLIKSKVLFLTFSIISAALFVPIMILSYVGAFIMRGSHEHLVVAGVVTAILEFIVALASSCFSCKSQWAACKLEELRKTELRERYEDKMRNEENGMQTKEQESLNKNF